MLVRMNSGRAIKGSAKGGAAKMMIWHEVEVSRSLRWKEEFGRGKYLPHQGEKQREKAARSVGK